MVKSCSPVTKIYTVISLSVLGAVLSWVAIALPVTANQQLQCSVLYCNVGSKGIFGSSVMTVCQ